VFPPILIAVVLLNFSRYLLCAAVTSFTGYLQV